MPIIIPKSPLGQSSQSLGTLRLCSQEVKAVLSLGFYIFKDNTETFTSYCDDNMSYLHVLK